MSGSKVLPDSSASTLLNTMNIPEAMQPQILEETSKGTNLDDFFGKQGLLAKFFGTRIEELLRAELTGHLGYNRHDASSRSQRVDQNYRNGSYPKTIQTSTSEIEIQVPSVVNWGMILTNLLFTLKVESNQ